ncbi:MAG: hypothetical protein GWO81_03685, partial [Verrucomicrobia bacterium]|nr:hypothetical protein [Verrucomicrobiota bacterium]
VVVCADGSNGTEVFSERGITLWELPHPKGKLDWAAFRERCAAEGIYAVYLEPGPTLSAALLAQAEVDYLFHYIAPMASSDAACDSLTGSYALREQQASSHGADRLVRGWLQK